MIQTRISVLSDGPFAASQLVLPDSASLVVLETSGQEIPPALVRAPTTGDFSDDWPMREALRLDSALREASMIALFAALLVRSRRVSVCTAGDIRVHLVREGNLVAVTRDHVLLADSPMHPSIPRFPADLAASVFSRCIGAEGEARPESITWQVDGDYSLLICSSQIHRHRDPSKYVGEVARAESLGHTEGFLCQIEVTTNRLAYPEGE